MDSELHEKHLPNELIFEMSKFIPAAAFMTEGFLSRTRPIIAFTYPRCKTFLQWKELSFRQWSLRNKLMELKRELFRKTLLTVKVDLRLVADVRPIDENKVDELAQRVNILEKQKDELENESAIFDKEWSKFCASWERSKEFAEKLMGANNLTSTTKTENASHQKRRKGSGSEEDDLIPIKISKH